MLRALALVQILSLLLTVILSPSMKRGDCIHSSGCCQSQGGRYIHKTLTVTVKRIYLIAIFASLTILKIWFPSFGRESSSQTWGLCFFKKNKEKGRSADETRVILQGLSFPLSLAGSWQCLPPPIYVDQHIPTSDLR